MLLTADFETITDPNDCRVWAWAVCEIGNPEYFQHGNSIESFFTFMEKSKNSTFYFHNLKFDDAFIFNHLFSLGFKHVKSRAEEATKTFTTLISDTGQHYSIKIIFEKKGKRTKYVKIYDSLKIIPFGVDEIVKSFNLPISKLKIDYKYVRPIGHVLTQEEIDYIRNDVDIVARALKTLFDQDLKKMTQGSNALYDYKQTVGTTNFERWFPIPDYDEDVRQSYKGGFTYLNPSYKEVDIGEGLVLDVNSLYPSVMKYCKLPFGEPIFFKGKYVQDDVYDLYVQMFECQFRLKPNHIPTVQLKGNLSFIPTEYITTSGDKSVTMCMTSVDLKLFEEHYEILNPEWRSGWKFKSTTGLFSEYIDKWTKVKIESKRTANKGMYTLSKLMLNALYGKFALNPKVASKYPYMEDGIVKYFTPQEEYIDERGKKRKRTLYETRNPIYIPVGTFITAWARYKTITNAQKMYNHFVYADTDSLHLNIKLPETLSNLSNDELEEMTTADFQKHGLPFPDDFVIDPYELGAWKVESRFTRARFIRQKSYIEDWNAPNTWDKQQFSTSKLKELCERDGLDYEEVKEYYEGWYDTDLLNITCAGMPNQCYPFVTWDNFHEGQDYPGKLVPKSVKGGIILQEVKFTILKS